MTFDKTKASFASSFEIDHILKTGSRDTGVGTGILDTYDNLSEPPVFEVHFQPSGANYWEQAGRIHAYVDAGNLYVTTTEAGTCRWFIWSDKVNY